jgi:hypothetical protein
MGSLTLTNSSIQDLEGKVFIVTGGNSGLVSLHSPARFVLGGIRLCACTQARQFLSDTPASPLPQGLLPPAALTAYGCSGPARQPLVSTAQELCCDVPSPPTPVPCCCCLLLLLLLLVCPTGL